MTTTDLSFPKGAFAAFSTAKMSYFLPVDKNISRQTLDDFFGDDAKFVALTPLPSVELHLPGTEPQIATPGQLIAHFINGKYKVISADYYHKNFSDPILEAGDAHEL